MYHSGEYIINNNKDKIKDILQSHGYKIIDCGNYIQFPALWRNGDDTTSVTCYPESGLIIDWVTSEKFDVKELFARVLKLKSENEINEALKNINIVTNNHRQEEIKQTKVFDKELLLYLQKDHDYLINRGISENTAKLFDGGVASESLKGKMRNRYVFPIFDSKSQIVGFTGRTLNNDKRKWIHFGNKSNWVWPGHISSKNIIKSKCVILVESPICCLKLYDSGIKNVLCLFGTDLSLGILNYLLRANVQKVIISLNNELDSKNGGVGNEASLKIKKRLSKYFDSNNCIIFLPKAKDFGEMDNPSIQSWINELKLLIGDEYFKYD